MTVPPFMPPIQQGGPRPGTASQPGPVVRPYAAPPVPSRRTATPVMLAAIDDAALTASVTAEHTTRAVPYDGEHYFAPVNSPLSSPGLASFSDDPASITVELRRMPQAYAAPVRPVPPAPEPERFADPADEAIPSIDAYVMRAESSGEDETPDAEAITDDAVVAGMKETDLPPAPYFSIDPPASIAAAMPPMPGQEIVAAPAEVIAPSLEDIERERAALVEAIVGAVEHAAEDEDVARDRKIDRDAVRLFSADPFGDDAEESRPPAPPSPFDDDPDVSHNMMSGRINDLADAPYAGRPTPIEPWSPPGFSRPWGPTPGPMRSVTPPLGIPVAPPPVSEYPPVPPFGNPRSPTPTHFTSIVPPRVTPLASPPVAPPRAASRPTPVRSATPVFVPIPTPLSVPAVPAVPDLPGARAVASALETVAAKIRAGHLVVGGEIPEGLDEEASYAGYLAAALAALLGVRH